MATDTLDDLADRLRLRGLKPRQVGDNSWECRCPGRSPVEHSLHFGHDKNGKFFFQCQSPKNCTLPGNLEILKQRYRDQYMQPEEVAGQRAAESQRPFRQDPELSVSESSPLAAATVPGAPVPGDDDGITDFSAVSDGSHQESPTGEVAAAAPTEDPALGDDSDGSTPATSGDAEKTGATQ
jgi:hypothetical protein